MIRLGQVLYKYVINSTGKLEGENSFNTQTNWVPNGSYITKLGISAPSGTKFLINGETITIGNSGLFEVQGVSITSLRLAEEANQVMVNFCYEDGSVV